MFNGKFSALFAVGAFVLSFLVGLLSGASFLVLLLRAFIFSLVFFGLASAAYWLVAQFMPELVGAAGSDAVELALETDGRGSRVDVTLGDDQESAEFGPDSMDAASGMRKAGLDESGESQPAAGGESALGLDHTDEAGYTEGVAQSENVFAQKGAAPALPSDMLDDVDVLPDLGSMADSFVSPIADESGTGSEGSSSQGRGSKASASSASRGSGSAGGDFDTREMASAIQTILKRDQKG